MGKISFCDYLVDYLEIENISQHEFSKSIGVNQAQLSMVLNKKRKLSFELMEKIAMVTPFKLEEIVKIESEYMSDLRIQKEIEESNDSVEEYIKRYQYNKLEDFDSNLVLLHKEDKFQVVKDIMKYLRISSPYINKESNVLFKSKHDKVELVNLWLEKCYRVTKNQEVGEYKKENIDKLIKYISKVNTNSVKKKDTIIKKFNENGIRLCFVEDLPGSKIRGAFKVQNNIPSIYLTLKHKRLADVAFALLHELAHCRTDFNSAKLTSYVSLENGVSKEENSELLADQTAYNWMIPDSILSEIEEDFEIGRFEEYVEKYKLNPMFFVYRLAASKKFDFQYSNKLYQKYNPVFTY